MVDQQQVVHFDDAAHNALVRIHDGVRGEKDEHCEVERWELLGAAVPKQDAYDDHSVGYQLSQQQDGIERVGCHGHLHKPRHGVTSSELRT